MRIFRHKRKSRGMSLPELMVSMTLFSVVSLVTLQLYMSAYTEFEHSSGTMTLNQRARATVDRITQALKTAVPVLPKGVNTEAFIHPNGTVTDTNKPFYECDFMSSICFMPNPALGTPTWQITDNASAGYVNDPSDPRYIYEVDTGVTSLVTRQPPLYRFRIAWNSHPTNTETAKGRSVPPRAVYMERLTFGSGVGALGWGEGTNGTSYTNNTLLGVNADTGQPYAQLRQRILGRNVHLLTFTRTQGNVIMLRLKMYNRDPVTWRPVEGLTMRRSGFGSRRDPNATAGQPGERLFLVDLVTNVQLPNTI